MRAVFLCAATLLVLLNLATATAETNDAPAASDLFPTAEKIAADKANADNNENGNKMAYAYTPGAIKEWFKSTHRAQFRAQLAEFYTDAKGDGDYAAQIDKVGEKFYPYRLAALWKGLMQKYPKTRRARLSAVLNGCKPSRANAYCQLPLDRTTSAFERESGGVATQYEWVGDLETGRHVIEPFVPKKRAAECTDLLNNGNSFFEKLLSEEEYTKKDKNVAFANALTSYSACLEKDANFTPCALAMAQAIMDPAWHPNKTPSWNEVDDVVFVLRHVLSLTEESKPIGTHRLLSEALDMRGDHDLACQQVAKVFQLLPTSDKDFDLIQVKMNQCKEGLKAMHDEI